MAEYILSEDTIKKIKQAARDNFSEDHIHPGYYAGTVQRELPNGQTSETRTRSLITTRGVFKLLKQ